MSEVVEGYRAMREVVQEERAERREEAVDLLNAAGVRFDWRNEGRHLIVHHGGRSFDLWPGPGRWRERTNQAKTRFGIDKLFATMGVPMPKENP